MALNICFLAPVLHGEEDSGIRLLFHETQTQMKESMFKNQSPVHVLEWGILTLSKQQQESQG